VSASHFSNTKGVDIVFNLSVEESATGVMLDVIVVRFIGFGAGGVEVVFVFVKSLDFSADLGVDSEPLVGLAEIGVAAGDCAAEDEPASF
jgi:hypothetical protein